MIPITCANTSSMPNMMNTMVNMVMPGNHNGFIPLCMGEPVMYNMGEEAPRGSRTAPSHAQFELPNCLAVKSCMTHQEQGATKKGVPKRSEEGSRSISFKGGSDSAMESITSPSEPTKARSLLDPNNLNIKPQDMCSSSQSLYSFLHSPSEPTKAKSLLDPNNLNIKPQDMCSSSQSLYSFLHSSDENEAAPDYSEGDDQLSSVRQVARPILSEPFWNEGVLISESLMKTYQMEEFELELVLKKDLEKLEKMKQSEVVNSQLMVRTNRRIL